MLDTQVPNVQQQFGSLALGGFGGMLQEILGVLRRILVHSEAYKEADRVS